jgi:hypothetical protein
MAWLDLWTGIWSEAWGSFVEQSASSNDSLYFNTLIEIYDDINTDVMLEVLHARMEPTCLSELRGHGAGSFLISKSDAKVLANPSLIDYRKYVKVRLNGNVVGGFIIQTKRTTIVGAGEEADEVWAISGEGPRSWVRDAAVYPPKGLKESSGDTRYFNFATEQGSWYNPTDWVDATFTTTVRTGRWGTAPSQWPDAPNAQWIWDRPLSPVPKGFVYFRREFNVATAGAFSFFFAVDDAAEVYLDGELLHTTAEHAWQETTRLDFDLEAGDHIIGVKAYNYKADGPGGFVAALFKYGDPLIPSSASLVLVTNSDWKINPYPANEPGWTPGDVLLTLLNEAELRGVRFASNFTPTFTEELDSAGVSWGTPVPWSFSVGATYEDVIEAIEELGCDIWVNPDTLELYAWKKRGVDRTAATTPNAIILTPGLNLVSADETGQAEIANTLLLHAQDGWKESSYTDTTSLTKYGRVETQMSTQLSTTGAAPLVDELFRTKALPEKSATFELIPVEGMIPFLNFNVGDTISAPGEVPGVLESRRVMSISFSENGETGAPEFAVEFDTIFRDRTTELEKWISRISNSSAIGGGCSNSSALPPTATQGTPGATLGTIPDAPTGVVVSSIGEFSPDGSSSSDYSVTWNPVVTGEGLGTVEVTSYEVWARRTDETEPRFEGIFFDTFAYLTGYRPGETWAFKVRAISRTGGPGPFSAEVSLTAANPVIVMSAPSAPSLTSTKGTVTINWNGLMGGQPAPGYVRYVRVERTGSGSNGSWTEKRRNMFWNPRATALTRFGTTGSTSTALSLRTDMTAPTTTAVRATRNATGNVRLLDLVVGTTMTANTQYRLRARVRSSTALTGVLVYARPTVANSTSQVLWATVDIPSGVSIIDMVGFSHSSAPTSTAGVTITHSGTTIGATLDITDILIEKTPSDGTMIAGDITSSDPTKRYRWLGTAGDSASVYEENDPWVQVGTLVRGSTVDASVMVGKTYDYRLVAVDTYGGTSTPSSSVSITVSGVQSGDISGGLVSLNLVANGNFESGFSNWELVSIYPNGGAAAFVQTENGLSGANYLQMTRGAEIVGGEVDLTVGQALDSYIPVSAVGQYGYFVSAKVAGPSSVAGAFGLYVRWFQGDKTTPSATPQSTVVEFEAVSTTAKIVVGQVFPPEDARFMQVTLVVTSPGMTVYVDDVIVREVVTSSQIGEDAVTSIHLSAGSVTANAIQTGSIDADKMAVGAVTADTIEAGAVTASKLAADVGSSLDISSNESINLLINRQDEVEGEVADATQGVSDLQTYYSFGAEGAIIGQTDSAFKLYLKNDKIEILENGAVVSYWDSGQMTVERFVGNEVVLANHKFETYGTGTVIRRI